MAHEQEPEAESLVDGQSAVDAPWVACLTAPMTDAKEMLAACEKAEIPAALATDPCCSKGGGCAPKVSLMVPPSEVPRVAELLRDRWMALVEREGVDPSAFVAGPGVDGEPPCPACGTAAPLVDNACSDCGLVLA